MGLSIKCEKSDFFGFCRICVLFDENKTGAHRRKDVKNALQKLAKSDKISEHGDTKYHPMTCKL